MNHGKYGNIYNLVLGLEKVLIQSSLKCSKLIFSSSFCPLLNKRTAISGSQKVSFSDNLFIKFVFIWRMLTSFTICSVQNQSKYSNTEPDRFHSSSETDLNLHLQHIRQNFYIFCFTFTFYFIEFSIIQFYFRFFFMKLK